MINIKLKSSNIILTPISEYELENEIFEWASIYVLYKNNKSEIEIGIPDMQKYLPEIANLFGYNDSIESAFFYSGELKLMESAKIIKDRPVYKITLTDDKQKSYYTIINNVDIKFEDVINGNFTVKNNKKIKSLLK